MANILLVKVGTDDGSFSAVPSLGMGVVARRLKDIGHRCTVLDGHYFKFDGSLDDVANVDVVAFSAVSFEWDAIRTIMNQHPDRTYLLGGPHAFSYWDLIKDGPCRMKIVVGEADCLTNEELMSDGVTFCKRPETDDLLTPDFTTFYGYNQMGSYSLYTSRGCTGAKCNFCQSGKAHGKYRIRRLDSIKDELAQIPKLFPNVGTVHVIDDSFTGDIDHAKAFLEHYVEKGYADRYKLHVFNIRADQVDLEALKLLERCHVDNLPIGLESADPMVFGHVGKGETLEQIRDCIELIHKTSIVPWLNMIVGLPYDNLERTVNSIEWVRSIPEPKIVHYFMYAPFRGTRAYKWLVEKGAIKDGFIPSPYCRRYNTIPLHSDFETADFTFEQRRAAHLLSYLRTYSPLLMCNIDEVQTLCRKYGWEPLYNDWMINVPAEDFATTGMRQGIHKKEME